MSAYQSQCWVIPHVLPDLKRAIEGVLLAERGEDDAALSDDQKATVPNGSDAEDLTGGRQRVNDGERGVDGMGGREGWTTVGQMMLCGREAQHAQE